MDSYLEIAEIVLRRARRPLRPMTILDSAYFQGIVPAHLHGKTQQKTLQARLSEDILIRREKSLFFRTAPGVFFLREFLNDTSLPEEYRTPIPTRRRVRELRRGPALALNKSDLKSIVCQDGWVESSKILDLLHSERFIYDDPNKPSKDSVFIWAFATIRKRMEILSYRVGRYREDRDPFLYKRTIGFSTLVNQNDMNLFNSSDFGIIDSGVHAALIDLDVYSSSENHEEHWKDAHLMYFSWTTSEDDSSDLLAVIKMQCPNWFEPTKRRLAMNDLRWLDMSTPLNDIDDFDPWSRSIVEREGRWGGKARFCYNE